MLSLFLFISAATFAGERATNDIKQMKPYGNDSFQIICIDGIIQYLSAAEIEAGFACNQIKTSRYDNMKLIDQNINDENKKLCSFEITLKKSSINNFYYAEVLSEKVCKEASYSLNCRVVNELKTVCENSEISVSLSRSVYNPSDRFDSTVMTYLSTNEIGEFRILN